MQLISIVMHFNITQIYSKITQTIYARIQLLNKNPILIFISEEI